MAILDANWTDDEVEGRAGCLNLPRAGGYVIHRHHDDGWALYLSDGVEIAPEMCRTTEQIAGGLSIIELRALLNRMEVR
jgi:hypothetical protein